MYISKYQSRHFKSYQVGGPALLLRSSKRQHYLYFWDHLHEEANISIKINMFIYESQNIYLGDGQHFIFIWLSFLLRRWSTFHFYMVIISTEEMVNIFILIWSKILPKRWSIILCQKHRRPLAESVIHQICMSRIFCLITNKQVLFWPKEPVEIRMNIIIHIHHCC